MSRGKIQPAVIHLEIEIDAWLGAEQRRRRTQPDASARAVRGSMIERRLQPPRRAQQVARTLRQALALVRQPQRMGGTVGSRTPCCRSKRDTALDSAEVVVPARRAASANDPASMTRAKWSRLTRRWYPAGVDMMAT